MEKRKIEDCKMTNKQTLAMLEAVKIIAEKSKDIEEIKNALDRIQDVLKNEKKPE